MLRRLRSLFRTTPATSDLRQQARSLDPDVRHAAINGLRQVPEPWASTLLIDLLGDTHSIVRDASRDALVRMEDDAVPVLIEGLKHGSPDIARVVAEMLGTMRAAAAAEALLLTLKYAVRPVQMEAKRALIRIGPPAIPILEAALAEEQPWLQQQVREALAAIQQTPSA